MKWGKRRYQNTDGSLTSAGKKRYNEDSDNLAYDVAKKVEAIKDFRDSTSRFKQLNTPTNSDKNELLYKMSKAQASYQKVNDTVRKLNKKYKKVDFDIMHEAETGEAYVRTMLENKFGETYISEIYLGYHIAK